MWRRIFLVARTVWLEFLRRKEFYVLFILVGMFVLGIVVLRIIGVENEGTARFLMSFGLLLSYALAAILTAVTAARQLPEEIEKRTLQPLLAKPISRPEVVLGKCLAVLTVACTTLLLLMMLSWVPVPKLPDQRLFVFVQMVALRMVGLCLLGVFTTALSLLMPTVVAVLIALTTFFAASTIINFVGDVVRNFWRFGGWLAERILSLVPDFSLFEHSQRYVEGASPLTVLSTAVILAYGAIFVGFFYFLTVWSFNRRLL